MIIKINKTLNTNNNVTIIINNTVVKKIHNITVTNTIKLMNNIRKGVGNQQNITVIYRNQII